MVPPDLGAKLTSDPNIESETLFCAYFRKDSITFLKGFWQRVESPLMDYAVDPFLHTIWTCRALVPPQVLV